LTVKKQHNFETTPKQRGSLMQPRYTEPGTADRPTQRAKSGAAGSEVKPQEKAKETTQKSVEFAYNAPQAKSVVVAGSFNNWDAKKTPLQREGDRWKARIPLAPGRYEYRFVVDGHWITDPNSKETVRNDYGSTNSVLVV